MTSKNHTYLSTGCLQLFICNFHVIRILIAFLVFSGCSSTSTRAPVSSREPPPSTKVSSHIVAPGETLYSIAWRYGMDYKALARANDIGTAYTIFPGQIIQLKEFFEPVYKKPPVVVSSTPRTVAQPQSSTNNKQPEQKTISPTKTPVLPITRPISSARSENKSSPSQSPSASSVNSGKIIWRWPASGKVLTNFYDGKSYKRGIDIEGEKGDAVIAAAAGEIVYAGSGLRGYGKLVIIKHSDTYLSAYAHNHRLRVQEGDFVNAGQRIADIGSTGTGTKGKPKLHFQIRQDGKSVDPLKLLPKRKS